MHDLTVNSVSVGPDSAGNSITNTIRGSRLRAGAAVLSACVGVLVAVGLNAQGVADGEGSSGDWVWGGVCFAGVVALIAGVQWSQGGRRWLSVSAVCLLVAAVSFLSASTRMLRSPPMPVAPGLLTIEGWVAEPVRKLEARPGVRFRGDAGALSAFADRKSVV